MIRRTAEKELKKMVKAFPVLMISGPRQSGKTTLVKHLFKKLPYVLLEDEDERDFALHDPRGFLARFPHGAILDEVQRTPNLLSYLLGIVDADKKKQFILTGSQNILLSSTVSQSLAGRVGILYLLPLSLEELKIKQSPSASLETIMFRGFYPKIHQEHLPAQKWLRSYFHTYIERDIRQLSNIGNLNTFQRFVRLCAARSGGILNLSALANDAGVTHPTAKSWISILEASFIITLLEPHYQNFSKRLIKAPKLYFLDTGLLCYLLRISSASVLHTHALRGAIFETFMVSELYKRYMHRGQDAPLFFWRDHTGHEVDVLIEQNDVLLPIEIKSSRTITSETFKNLNFWLQLPQNPNTNAMVVYAGDKSYTRGTTLVNSWSNISLP
jgi:uncharacterized protein